MDGRDRQGPAPGRTTTRGQALPVVALQLWAIAGVATLVMMVGAQAVDRSRAQVAADAVALGVASGGDPGALADANQASIEQLEQGAEVDVVVRVGDATAAARAAAPRIQWRGLAPGLQDALARAERVLGEPIPIVSGLRSRADQQRLWDNRSGNPFPVAPPGTSLHELGLAIDVPLSFVARLATVAGSAGLCQPLPATDPVHFVLC